MTAITPETAKENGMGSKGMRNALLGVVIVLLGALLCAKQSEAQTEKVVVWGDSICEAPGWAEILWPNNVTNLCKGGTETSFWAAPHPLIDLATVQANPDRIAIQLGTNDSAGLSPELYAENMLVIINHLYDLGYPDIVIASRPFTRWGEDSVQNDWIASYRVIDEELCDIIPSVTCNLPTDWMVAPELFVDGVHLTPLGHTAMAATIPVPEPDSVTLAMAGLVTMGYIARRRRKA